MYAFNQAHAIVIVHSLLLSFDLSCNVYLPCNMVVVELGTEICPRLRYAGDKSGLRLLFVDMDLVGPLCARLLLGQGGKGNCRTANLAELA